MDIEATKVKVSTLNRIEGYSKEAIALEFSIEESDEDRDEWDIILPMGSISSLSTWDTLIHCEHADSDYIYNEEGIIYLKCNGDVVSMPYEEILLQLLLE